MQKVMVIKCAEIVVQSVRNCGSKNYEIYMVKIFGVSVGCLEGVCGMSALQETDQGQQDNCS